ncbi:MAG: response regulator [Clostridium lundense]|nr:response regulator [Clostridium lundense]
MKKVIVIDDTKNIRNLLTTCLQINGYKVSTASSGEEALNLFLKEHFDLAFLDIKMPEISGTEVLRRIRLMGLDIPVVIMTAFATVKNAVECTKLGAVAYLQKPFTADKVKTVLEEINQYTVCEKSNVESKLIISKELLQNGKIDEAFNCLKSILSMDPSCSECYDLIGRVHELKGDVEEAQKFYTAAKQFR